MARVQVFDDGSTLTLADDGYPLSYTEATDRNVVPGAASIQDRFFNLLEYGVRAAIGPNYGAAPSAAAQSAAVAAAQRQAQQNSIVRLLVLGGIAYLAYRALA